MEGAREESEARWVRVVRQVRVKDGILRDASVVLVSGDARDWVMTARRAPSGGSSPLETTLALLKGRHPEGMGRKPFAHPQFKAKPGTLLRLAQHGVADDRGDPSTVC